jgi:tryptophan synthase alpha chain
MSLRKTLQSARTEKRSAFIPFVMAGDPDLDTSADIIMALQEAGAEVLELGIPFSDPVADGITVQKAADRALQSGTTLEKAFELLKTLRNKGLHIPVCLFSYLNPVFHMGYENFVKAARDAGADGALIVDLPPEEAPEYLAAAAAGGLETVFLCSPTTSPARLQLIDEASSGFVYYVSREGVTGAQTNLADSLQQKLAQLRQDLKNPLAVGFGISTPEHVAALQGMADGIVVGSALVKIVEEHTTQAAVEIACKTRSLLGKSTP